MNFGDPLTFLLRVLFFIPALLIGFTLHEFAHALVAVRQGDPTPKNQGRLSLDPRRHLHPLGTIMVLLAGVGFAKPVMVNPRNFKRDRSALMVALAGPAANLLIAIVASVLLKIMANLTAVNGFPNFQTTCIPGVFQLHPLEILKAELYVVYTLNLYLMVFNLLPVPPLDGFEIIRTTLRKSNPRLLYQIESNRDSIVLIFVLIALVASSILFFVMGLVVNPVATLLGVPIGFPCQ
ncbi:MAG: site-2 protease family protein [Candidatus Dormibacteria bacterium]